MVLNGAAAGRGPGALIGCRGCQKLVAELAAEALHTIQKQFCLWAPRADLLGRHERNSCVEKAVASIPSEGALWRILTAGQKPLTVSPWGWGRGSADILGATIRTGTSLDAISELFRLSGLLNLQVTGNSNPNQLGRKAD